MKKHLIVDGYNIINKWPALKKAILKSLSFARQSLLEELMLYADYEDVKVTVVFDGGNNEVEQDKLDGIDVIFSRGKTADATIEQLVYECQDRKSLVVATDDRKHQDMVFGMGAFYMSTSQLRQELDNSIRNFRYDLKKKS